MPKVPKFQVQNTPRGWKLNVPRSISDTGKKQELYFPTREKAQDKAKKLRDGYRSHGEMASALPPRVADDALKAWLILEPLGFTLTQAARELAARHDLEAKSVKVSQAVEEWIATAEAGLRKPTVKSYQSTASKLLPNLGDRNMASVTGGEILDLLKGKSLDLHWRNASALWGWASKLPRGWCHAGIFAGIEMSRQKSESDIGVLYPQQVMKLFEIAVAHFPETVCVYAVGFFGGARVEELKKLEGTEISSDGVEIGAKIAKKRRRRYIPMNDTLRAWLEKYPFKPCPNWVEKHKAVRALCGWDVKARILDHLPHATLGSWPRNAIRHTHASAEIANGALLEDLLFRFGHTEDAETLRSHYVGRYTKRQAVEYFSITPETLMLADQP
jgi:integrase/recombinase XerD